jgi:DNA (cytosine-5)-methyltransferase 1
MTQNGTAYRLPQLVRLTDAIGCSSLPTPQASDNRDRGCMEDASVKRRIKMGKQIGLSTAVKEKRTSGTLNPTWVEWLMGFPLGWTDLNA